MILISVKKICIYRISYIFCTFFHLQLRRNEACQKIRRREEIYAMYIIHQQLAVLIKKKADQNFKCLIT